MGRGERGSVTAGDGTPHRHPLTAPLLFPHAHQLGPQPAGRLGDDADLADDVHEVHVAAPAGDDVLVQVARHAGPGHPAQVEADVEPLGAHRRLQQPDGVDRLLGTSARSAGVSSSRSAAWRRGATSRWPLA